MQRVAPAQTDLVMRRVAVRDETDRRRQPLSE
jgi:hypothetical protein